MKKFEVELRSLVSKEKFGELLKKFTKLTKGSIDDANTYTFLTSEINIKVKELISQKRAKITVKNGAEYKQQAEETELEINPKDIKKAIKLIKSLGFKKYIPSFQKRINFNIDGIDVSLKYEPNWKYHVEAEIIVSRKSEVKAAKQTISKFFKKYGLKPISETQLKNLINSFVSKYGLEKI